MVMMESTNTATARGRFLLRAYARSAANPGRVPAKDASARDSGNKVEDRDVPAQGKYCNVSMTSSRIEVYTQLKTIAVSVEVGESSEVLGGPPLSDFS